MKRFITDELNAIPEHELQRRAARDAAEARDAATDSTLSPYEKHKALVNDAWKIDAQTMANTDSTLSPYDRLKASQSNAWKGS